MTTSTRKRRDDGEIDHRLPVLMYRLLACSHTAFHGIETARVENNESTTSINTIFLRRIQGTIFDLAFYRYLFSEGAQELIISSLYFADLQKETES